MQLVVYVMFCLCSRSAISNVISGFKVNSYVSDDVSARRTFRVVSQQSAVTFCRRKHIEREEENSEALGLSHATQVFSQ